MKKKPTKPTSTLEWTETIIPDKPTTRCDHHFQFNDEGECRCRRCGLGLIGVVDIVNGRPL